MHPLYNGSQVTARPARKATAGTPGYFTESNDNGQPSYPGQDWFNDVIDEFMALLTKAGIPYDPLLTDHLARAIPTLSTTAEAVAGVLDDVATTPFGVKNAIGQFGIGAGAPNISDANSQLTGRINTLVTPWTNGPISANGVLLCFGESNSINLQIYAVHGSGQVYWRFRTGVAGTTAWRKVWDDRNNGSISDALAGTSGVYADCSVLKNLLAQTTVGGSNQTWANYTASRVSNVNYTNNTYAPIVVSITASEDGATGVIYVGGVKIANFSDSGGDLATTSFIVPVGSTYKIIFTMNSQVIWSELR